MPKGKPVQKKKQWYLAVGVGQVDPSTELSKLPHASSDCEKIARLFDRGKLSPIDEVIALHDPVVAKSSIPIPTLGNVTEALEKITTQAGSEDTIVVYLTCHGVRDKQGKLYFCLSDTKGSSTQGIDLTTALSAQKLVTTLVESKAVNIILLIDSCHSGAIDLPQQQALEEQLNVQNQSLKEERTWYAILSCTFQRKSYSYDILGSALMSHCLQKALRGEIRLDDRYKCDDDPSTKTLLCDRLYNYLQTEMEKVEESVQRQIKVAHSDSEETVSQTQQKPTRKVNHGNPIIARIPIAPLDELQPRRGLVVNAINPQIEANLLAQLKEKASFSPMEAWDGTDTLLDAIEAKLKSVAGTVLFYIRGELLADNLLRINSHLNLPASNLYQMLEKYQSVKQILLFDLETENNSRIEAWREAIKIDSELGQCLVFNHYSKQSGSLAEEASKVLAATDSSEGLDAAQFITELKRDRSLKLKYYLSGKRDIIELMVAPQQQDIYKNLRFWQNYARKLLPQEISSNFLTAFVNSETTFEIQDFYVPLGLVERKERSKKEEIEDSQQGSSLYAAEAIKITQKFAGDEFFERILLNHEGKSQGKRIAIIGEPGSGKTTYSQKSCDWLFTNTQTVPIWISLARLGNNSLVEYLERVWLNNIALYSGLTVGQLKSALINQFQLGNVWLILDGVDEIASDNKLERIKSYLEEEYVSNARIILTCRLNSWETSHQLLTSFDTYRTLSFEDEQINNFIDNFIRVKTDKDSLLQQLENNQRIKDLVRNPLRLMLLCLAWLEGEQSLPETQAQLYDLFVARFYSFKQEQFPIFREENYSRNRELKKLIHQALGEISKAALNSDNPSFLLDLNNLDASLEKRLDIECEGKTIREWILILGWLNKVGVKADNTWQTVYSFFHATFQEYFAAKVINDWDYFVPRAHTNFPIPSKEYRIFESQWKQVILFWIGQPTINSREKEDFIGKLYGFDDGLPFEEDNNFDFNYSWQALTLAGFFTLEFQCKLNYKIWNDLIKYSIQYFFEKHNNNYFVSHYFISQKISIDRLFEIFEDYSINSWDYNTFAKEIFDQYKFLTSLLSIAKGNKTAIEVLCKIYKDTSIPVSTRRDVSAFLSEIALGNKTAIIVLSEICQDTSIPVSTRRDAAKTLGIIAPGNKTAIVVLSEICQDTSVNIWTRKDAAKNLSEIAPGNQTAITVLSRICINPSVSMQTRKDAAETLDKIAPRNKLVAKVLSRIYRDTSISMQTRKDAAKTSDKLSLGCLSMYEVLHTHLRRADIIENLKKITKDKYIKFYQLFHNTIQLKNSLEIVNERITLLQNKIQIIYINGDKFINRQNPVLDIYKQMVKQGCPKISNRPQTISELSAYWELDVSEMENLPVLIFYEDNTESNSSNFSTDLLDALGRFDGAICVISNATTPQSLKHFYPNQPNLIENVIDWIQHTFLDRA